MLSFPRALVALILSTAGAFAATDLTGKWSGVGGGPIYMVLKQDGNKLSGTAGPSAHEQLLELQNGAVDGDHVTFDVGPIRVDARVVGDEIRGDAMVGGQPSKLFLRRADKLNPDARFEVTSVKRVPRPPDGRISSSMNMDPGRIHCTNVTVKKLIWESWQIKEYQVTGPDWIDTELYNIDATMPPGTSGDQVLIMVRNLLKDRFQLALHSEMKEMTVYALTVGKNGPKMQQAEFGRGGTYTSPGKMVGKGVFMRNLTENLSRQLDMPVIDNTGLKGAFDFTLEWQPEPRGDSHAAGAPAPEASAGPSIFTAVQEQLGLKLEARKAPLEVLVVDRAERNPTGN
jgi:uncharacterized protein (TIGR03435 family)